MDNQLHDSNDHMLLQNEGWPYADLLVCNVRGHLSDNVHEGSPVHTEGLDPLFINPGIQDDLLPPAPTGAIEPRIGA